MPDRVLGGFRLREHRRCVMVELLSNVRHAELPRRAVDQSNAQAVLQLTDTMAERGFRHTKAARGGGKATAIHDLHEIEEIVEVEHNCVDRTMD
jgi:hypothetical protein